MEIATTIINTVILIALFWYQKNKNKVLEDRISEQSSLLTETKDVVTNQAQAIESQSKVVDSALQYSENFDSGKIEAIIKRELELEYKEALEERNAKIKKHENFLKEVPEAFSAAAQESAKEFAHEYVLPLAGELFGFLLLANDSKREAALSKIPKELADSMRPGLERFDKQVPSLLGARSKSANK